jgi:hypothetical protein
MSIKTLRIVLVIHALAIFAQAALAGEFLSGEDGAVAVHEIAGLMIPVICLIQIVLSFRVAPLSFSIATVAIFLCEGLQIGTGYGRFLNVHIPLSVVIAGVVVGQIVWAFRTQAASA